MIKITKHVRKRGFIALGLVFIVMIVLCLISASIMSLSASALKVEEWEVVNTERSLYTLAWSAANLILNSVSNEVYNFDSSSRIFISNDGETIWNKPIRLDTNTVSIEACIKGNARKLSEDIRIEAVAEYAGKRAVSRVQLKKGIVTWR